MVYFCELNKTGWEHATVNRHLLGLLNQTFPTEGIRCWLAKDHWAALPNKELFEGSVVSASFVRVIEPLQGNKVRWGTKLLAECRRVVWVFRKAQQDYPRIIFFSSASPLANLFITVLAKCCFKNQKVVIAMHGELQLLRVNNKKWIDRCYAWCLRKAFGMHLVNRRYLVLGEHIRAAVSRYNYLPLDQLMAIPHPLPSPVNGMVSRFGTPMVFGHIGVAKRAKNSQLFFELAKKIGSESSDRSVSFVLAGMVLDELKPLVKKCPDCVTVLGAMDPDAYAQACSAMTYAVFCYSDEEYELIGSGAVMDAIALEIPIVAIRNNYFVQLFAHSPVLPGILCEDFEALCEAVKQLIHKEEPRYLQMKEGVRQLKETFDNRNIQEIFSAQMKEFVTL